MTKVSPSFTAMVQALIRYMGTRNSGHSCITNDYLGYLFLDRHLSILKYRALMSLVIRRIEQKFPGGYGFSCCRSIIGDDTLQAFEGHQVVNLGAGFCTRSERYSESLLQGKKHVFELDLAPTQEKKKRIMSRHCPTGYNLTTYVSIDFEKQSIEDALVKEHENYNQETETLFFWDGVSMYLDEPAVDAVFSFVRNNSALGSLIVFDFCCLDYIESKGQCGNYYGGEVIYKTCVKKKEPLTFGIAVGGYQEWLKERGFSAVKFWTGKDLEEQFLTNSKGIVVHRAKTPCCICVARLDQKF
jgi:methyltransferase (TIGR00027 family)